MAWSKIYILIEQVIFLLLKKLIEYSSSTIFSKLDNLRGGDWSLVGQHVLEIVSICWYLHCIYQGHTNSSFAIVDFLI